MNGQRGGVWDAADCALLLIDYQDSVLAQVFEQDRRLIELNASYLARLAVRFGVPVCPARSASRWGYESRRSRRSPTSSRT
jgi:nicotinamidase-related amidase